MGALDDYNTKNITRAHAIFIVEMVKKSQSLVYPVGYDELKGICERLLAYMKENNLTETALYEQLNKKIGNFKITDENLKKINFEHIKSMPLDLHAELISRKFNIPYNSFQ